MKEKNNFLSSPGMRFLFTSPRVSGELKEAQKKCILCGGAAVHSDQ